MLISKHTLAENAHWPEGLPEHGVTALVDKAQHWTSFDVVAKLRGLSRCKKVGHAGTLDPLATGLLIVCFGRATKSIQGYQDGSKRYHARLKLGATTKTDDAEGPEENLQDVSDIPEAAIRRAVAAFTGDIEQIPPMFSAVKQDGVRLYKLARKGQTIERPPRPVHVYSIDISDISLPYLSLDVHCSKGTYVRSLARDIGEKLGCGAYLAGLRRTGIGEFRVDDALTVDELAAGTFRRADDSRQTPHAKDHTGSAGTQAEAVHTA